jgi:antitoxin component YwqK of YwqJK toxin-antitoxin module
MFAQVNQVDSKGRKQGQWEKVYPGTRVYMYRGQFENDKPVGKFTYYYKSSKVKAIINHNALEPGRSVAFYYHESGKVMSYGIYRNQKKDSVWANFTPSGRISFTETYKNDKLHGLKRVYFIPEKMEDKSQIVSAEMNYENGMLQGECKEFFLTKRVKTIGFYKDNKQHGAWQEFHPNGKRAAVVRYFHGKKHGYAIAYDETEKRIGEQFYFNGRRLEGKELEETLAKLKAKGINPYTMSTK